MWWSIMLGCTHGTMHCQAISTGDDDRGCTSHVEHFFLVFICVKAYFVFRVSSFNSTGNDCAAVKHPFVDIRQPDSYTVC